MGRTKNARPKRHVPAVSQEPSLPPPPLPSPPPTTPPRAPKTGRVVQVAVGPNLTIPLQIDSPKKKTTKRPPPKKRRRIIIDDDDEEEGNDEAIALPETKEVERKPNGDLTIQQQNKNNNNNNLLEKQRLVKEFSLSLPVVIVNDRNKPLDTESFSVVTCEGVVALIQAAHNGGGGDGVDDGKDWLPLGLAVEEGNLCVEGSTKRSNDDNNNTTTNTVVRIYITKNGVEVCSPQKFAMRKSHRKPAKQYQSAHCVHQALALLFPDSVVAHVLRKKRGSSPITAKMVYNLVDNVQLCQEQQQEQRQQGNKQPLIVEGLVPQLRPYQEAAVRWMLGREKNHPKTGPLSEWELAWVILEAGQSPKTLTCWKGQAKDPEPPLLYCPFAGWLVQSHEAARVATLGLQPTPVRGGILAESMGLGKTVEVLACILANPFQPPTTTTAITNETTNNNTATVDVGESFIPSEADSPSVVTPQSTPTKQRPLQENEESNRVAKSIGLSLAMEADAEHGICFCGRTTQYRGCLGLVACESCGETMHGLCAGFTDAEQIARETTPGPMRRCSASKCPHCVFSKRSEGLIESRATLIITPATILNQWQREIRRHTNLSRGNPPTTPTDSSPSRSKATPLKVLVYPGIQRLFESNRQAEDEETPPDCQLVHPRLLADADVVLMTFGALLGDLRHSDENPFLDDGGLRLRARKRYRFAPSPLSSIKWWRVCLDEAQRVEVPTAMSARMAGKLECHHRWCVSGTPIGRGKLDDLYGLLLFLRLQPFATQQWFNSCFRPDCDGVMDRVRHLLQHAFWRSTKTNESVREQMGVPAQIEKKVLLRFSSIEKHFYERQLEQTLLAASEVVGKQSSSKRSGKKRSVKVEALSQAIHRLRAACCHPQVGSRGLGKPAKKRKAQDSSGENVSSGVLTMDQILDRLIDDARLKCEEAQRLAVLHTNGMAAVSRLKVDARGKGVNFSKSDEELLAESCNLYLESLEMAESNSKPWTVIGEALLTGCQGFQSPRLVVRDGRANSQWLVRTQSDQQMDVRDIREVWCRFDFEGPSKNICEVRVRPISEVPKKLTEEAVPCLLKPRDCVFQVAHTALGGEFVDVASFSLATTKPDTNGWISVGDFRTNRSKGWRFVIKTYDCDAEVDLSTAFVGVEIQLMEPDIASDSLQRLHVLHNGSLSLQSLIQTRQDSDESPLKLGNATMSSTEIKEKVDGMQEECRKIESLYMGGARALHGSVQSDLSLATASRDDAMTALISASPILSKASSSQRADFWSDAWWNDMLSIYFLYGSIQERQSLCDRVMLALDEFVETQVGLEYKSKVPFVQRYKGFPNFHDVDGLRAGLQLRLGDVVQQCGPCGHAQCLDKVGSLSSTPTEAETIENSHCGKCHADWNQTGPTCRHCKLEDELLSLDLDRFLMQILNTLWKFLRDNKARGRLAAARKEASIDERAESFFEVIKAAQDELQRAKKAWRIHSDLLNDIDEVNQSKRSVRLVTEGEDLTRLTDDELNAVVIPLDINTRFMDHGAKQAMALANLRRHTSTLRYLRNQSKELQEEAQRKAAAKEDEESRDGAASCLLCLSPLDGERAVLVCGHSFHLSCVDKLCTRSSSIISCPLRCAQKTYRDKLMVATDKRKDDGSKSSRDVNGSFGTKVTRLVGDLMDVSDLGEKSVVFSQWEDMLEVVEHALLANNIGYVRVKGVPSIGASIKRFRANDVTVLLLNVKNGAEGLTLVEATHVFMVEPLLNCGLDNQGKQIGMGSL